MDRLPEPFAASVLLGWLVACTPTPEAEPTKAEPAAIAPTKAAPADVAPAKTPQPAVIGQPAPPSSPKPPPLRVAAKREDYVEILAHGGRPWLSLDGIPVPLVDGAFTPLPSGGKGTMQCESGWQCNVAALVGDPSGQHGVWLTVEDVVERVGERYGVYHHDGQQWREKTLRKGVLVGHYDPLVELRGAVIGFQRWQPDPTLELASGDPDTDPKQDAKYQARRDQALRRAKQGFVQLAGTEVELPRVPEGLRIDRASTTPDGSLWALAYPLEPAEGRPEPRLLVWPPNVVEPQTVAVPELERARVTSLSTSNGWVLLGGCMVAGQSEQEDEACAEAYLALGDGETWQRVPIELPAQRPSSLEVMGAARSPDGALWVVFGEPWFETARFEAAPLWYRPPSGPWQAVPVPASETVFGRPTHADSSRPAGSEPVPAWTGRGLVWGADAVWAVLVDSDSRSAVLTSQPGTSPTMELPDHSRSQAERTPWPMPPEEELP